MKRSPELVALAGERHGFLDRSAHLFLHNSAPFDSLPWPAVPIQSQPIDGFREK